MITRALAYPKNRGANKHFFIIEINRGVIYTMVYPMLINTTENNLRVIYKQKVSTNEIKNKNKTYSYQEVNIPVELLKYWQSITNEKINTIAYVVSLYDGLKTTFITPLNCMPEDVRLYDTDISIVHNSPEVVTPVRVIPIRVHKRGKPEKPKYFVRLNNKEFITGVEYVEFIINPYLDDPILRVKGLVSVANLVML